MRAPANPPASQLGRLATLAVALLLAATTATASALADEPSNDPESSSLASYLTNGYMRVSADVALSADDPEPVLGSFTIDGLTYAVTNEGEVALVAVAPSTLAGGLAGGSVGAEGAGRGIGSGWTTSPQPQPTPSAEASGLEGEGAAATGSDGTSLARIAGSAVASVLADGGFAPDAVGSDGPKEGGDGMGLPSLAAGALAVSDEGEGSLGVADASGLATLALPEAVSHDGIDYALTALGPRALADCVAETVVVPASVASVDPTAFSGCAASAIEVADGNPNFSSYDGMLFDADQLRLLLIPEGKQGAARIPETAEEVDAAVFSHSDGVSAISVDAGSAAFSSRNGCLYDASGETLLRVPPRATDVEIPDGCTTVAAGALADCTKLQAISAPASVTEVSPQALIATPPAIEGAPTAAGRVFATAVLATTSSALPVDPASIEVTAPEGADPSCWKAAGFSLGESGEGSLRPSASAEGGPAVAGVSEAATAYGASDPTKFHVLAVGHGHFDVTSHNYYNSTQQTTGMTDLWVETQYSGGNIYLYEATFDIQIWGYRVKGNVVPDEGYRLIGYTNSPDLVASDVGLPWTWGFSGYAKRNVYAQFVPKTVTLAFDPKGGSFSGGSTAPAKASGAYSIGGTLGSILFPAAPTKAGHKFLGWFDAPTGGNSVTASCALPRDASVTYYAQWEAARYVIKLDATGSTVSPTEVSVTYGGDATLPRPAARTGYTFAGWNTKKDGTGVSLQAGVNKGLKLADGHPLRAVDGQHHHAHLGSQWRGGAADDHPGLCRHGQGGAADGAAHPGGLPLRRMVHGCPGRLAGARLHQVARGEHHLPCPLGAGGAVRDAARTIEHL